MKKNVFLLLILAVTISCQKDSPESFTEATDQESNVEFSPELKSGRFSFKNWEEFNGFYMSLVNLDSDELEAKSFYTTEKDDMEILPAIQGILNENNEFEVADQIIWFNEGNFYELDSEVNGITQKTSPKDLKEIGSVSYTLVNNGETSNDETEIGLAKTVPVANQHQFWKQKYIEKCGSGKTQGRSPRKFKYVHEVFAQYLSLGYIRQYSLHLRVKLEYNYRRNRWRLSGERREININITNNSFLRNQFGQVSSSYPSDIQRSIVFSSGCSSHVNRFLNSVEAPGLIPNAYWDVNVSGRIVEKMLGDDERNRWTDRISW
ncbi:hypothetical protein [Aquimarina sp. 2304DJ70-9]|uniref:hypothetical protein n=1 Tax=Aquimarina penaris TaxID=3231044 RepID=UPI003461B279